MYRRTALTVLALIIAGCGAATDETTLTLLTHDSFAVSEELLAEFEAETGYTVEVLRAADAGAMLTQAILTKDNPVADVLFGIDNTLLSRGLDAGLFVAYSSLHLGDLEPELILDPELRVSPVDYGDVCLNYDRSAFVDAPPPNGIADISEELAAALVVEHPATSSPGLAFLFATIGTFGEDGWQDYWRTLRAGGVTVAAGWEDAYYGHFSGGSGAGDKPIVVSYASSPVAEVYFATEPLSEAPTGVITDGCFRQVEFAGVLAGGNTQGGGALVDFLLSPAVQSDIPLNMFVFPANRLAVIPELFLEYAAVVPDPITFTPEYIEANRERWLREWDDAMSG